MSLMEIITVTALLAVIGLVVMAVRRAAPVRRHGPDFYVDGSNIGGSGASSGSECGDGGGGGGCD